MIDQLTRLKPWMLASRPRTLPICLAPIMVGTFLAFAIVQRIDWFLATSSFLSVLFLQIGTNLVNDALDFPKGADTKERLGPKRMTQAGLLSFKQTFRGGLICFGVAILIGTPLMITGGWPFAAILFFSILCGYLYTGGPVPLAYHGLGELFIFIFYGLVAIPSAFYLQTKFVNQTVFIGAIQMGFLAMIPNAVNNLRDRQSDAKVDKKTLAVRFGTTFACWEITFFAIIPFIIGIAWWFVNQPYLTLFPLGSSPLAFRLIKTIWETKQGTSYQASFAQSILLIFSFGLLLTVACLMRIAE
ncbi:1,4-dihydroxy-2-naphthoate octaprenyltransferase [Candidatus Protochlamydia sp. R18]|uniref:1,4-dihydroxy-2-naphthoate octaprenyltransferase n=1 Tax=Candidatus Protochlamydia sp. R18 TaxID=1353977 RepID=UPI0005A6EA7A|nr:1,4-dihydroxy-2-naphthoate octaprenyltransferase [Candidatus Protochlamydia sp. R18]